MPLAPSLNGQIERKISKSKNLRNFDLLGALEIRGYEKLRILLQKAHPCMNARRMSHFASKSGSELHGWTGTKSQKVTRGSHRNDVSPLIQGLRYRAACDYSRRRCHLASVCTKFRKFELIAVQGHPRSSILVSIESPCMTSY